MVGTAQHSTAWMDEKSFYMQDLIVGKSDGNIEVYAYDDGDDSEPILKFAYVSVKWMPLVLSILTYRTYQHLRFPELRRECDIG